VIGAHGRESIHVKRAEQNAAERDKQQVVEREKNWRENKLRMC